MMFLKVVVVVDENHQVKDLDALLDALEEKVSVPHDLVTLKGMVADSLAHTSPWENIHDKLIIDATTPMQNDPIGPVVKVPVGNSRNCFCYGWCSASKDAEAFYDGNNHRSAGRAGSGGEYGGRKRTVGESSETAYLGDHRFYLETGGFQGFEMAIHHRYRCGLTG